VGENVKSSSAAQIAALDVPVERRFYPRFVPSAPIRIGPVARNSGELFNISENGLLVSTPIALKLNFVSRISLPLEGLPSAIQVCARVVWTDESTMRAGIQLLDLSDQGREQIRKWGVLGSSLQDVTSPLAAAKIFVAPLAPTLTEQPSKEERIATPKPLPARGLPKRSTPALLAALLGLLVGTLCAGAVISFRGAYPPSISTGSTGNSGVPAAVVTIPDSPASSSQTPDSFSASGSENEMSENNPSSARASRKIIPPYASAPKAPNADPRDPAATTIHINRGRATRNQSDTAETESDSLIEQQRDTSALPHPSVSAAAETKTDDGNNESFNSGSSIASSQTVVSQPLPARSLSIDKVVPIPPPQHTPQGTPSNAASGQIIPNSAGPIFSSNASVAAAPSPSRMPGREILGVRTDGLSVIQMVPPRRSVLEVLTPVGSRSSVLVLPNERVLESPYITTRIRRTILLAPTRNWFFNRKKKVAVGELIARVDPQKPRDRIYSDVSVRAEATIAPDGHVERVQSVAGPTTLVPSVISAIRAWRYQPTLVDDKAVETECYIEMQFHAAGHTRNRIAEKPSE
jgi:hypothetical protein